MKHLPRFGLWLMLIGSPVLVWAEMLRSSVKPHPLGMGRRQRGLTVIDARCPVVVCQ